MSNGRTWTPDDSARLRRMAGAGYSDGEIARHLGFCRETVTRRRLCLGYTAGPKIGRRPRTFAALHLCKFSFAARLQTSLCA